MAVYIGIGFFVIIIGFCIFVAIGSMRTHSGGEKLVKLEIIIQDFQVLVVVVAVEVEVVVEVGINNSKLKRDLFNTEHNAVAA